MSRAQAPLPTSCYCHGPSPPGISPVSPPASKRVSLPISTPRGPLSTHQQEQLSFPLAHVTQTLVRALHVRKNNPRSSKEPLISPGIHSLMPLSLPPLHSGARTASMQPAHSRALPPPGRLCAPTSPWSTHLPLRVLLKRPLSEANLTFPRHTVTCPQPPAILPALMPVLLPKHLKCDAFTACLISCLLLARELHGHGILTVFSGVFQKARTVPAT